MSSLNEMMEEVYENNVAHGWFDAERTFGDDIALMHSEVSEALEAFRSWQFNDATAEVGEVDYSYEDSMGNCTRRLPPKPEGVGSEFADVLVRLLDSCKRYGINLEFEFERKMAYNRTRPIKHGGRNL